MCDEESESLGRAWVPLSPWVGSRLVVQWFDGWPILELSSPIRCAIVARKAHEEQCAKDAHTCMFVVIV